ncbi:MAG TPA: TOMM precursor leader peptide-binding protein [Streptosporangiaceae bacterium]|jgi:bacteriocin biosynthesis cyclodehydratase domain-containing protein|nr:TOMM precursor leader peptide-binding protein [Streptosporangiaceae bacterium]
MRPALKSGLLPVWRDPDTVQIGIDPRRAVALSGMGRAALVIGLLDGSRDRRQVIEAAMSHGVPASATERILTLLAAGGALDDFPASTLRELPSAARGRLACELATTSLAHRDADGGARSLARRRDVAIWIDGERRIGRAVARILSASGVVRVMIGSITDRRPDLAVLVGRQPTDLLADLVANQIPHLAVLAGEAIGVVGPLVIPGQTSCLRCLDYIRASTDPSWPLILAQLAQRQPDPAACDAVLTASVAAQAAAQALIAIDKSPAATAAVNGTLELVLPDWRWRRRTWRPHPACPCASHGASHAA